MPDRGGVITGVVIVVIVVLLLAGALLAGRIGARAARRRREAVVDTDVETLRYRVPNGQDPAMLVASLTHSGFAAVTEPVRDGKDVVVSCPDGWDTSGTACGRPSRTPRTWAAPTGRDRSTSGSSTSRSEGRARRGRARSIWDTRS
jgi:hypothetical protein